MKIPRCSPSCPSFETTFCPACGHADQRKLHGVRLAGFIGVQHSTSPDIERFWATGDPSVFAPKG